MKAQIAFEFLVIVGIVFAFLIPIWVYISTLETQSSDELNLRFAENSVRRIASAADLVGSQGAPAKAVIEVYIPKLVTNVTINATTVRIRINTAAGLSDVFSTSTNQLNGSLPIEEGSYKVSVEAKSGFVQISQVG